MNAKLAKVWDDLSPRGKEWLTWSLSALGILVMGGISLVMILNEFDLWRYVDAYFNLFQIDK